jgi:hypothetical protein
LQATARNSAVISLYASSARRPDADLASGMRTPTLRYAMEPPLLTLTIAVQAHR